MELKVLNQYPDQDATGARLQELLAEFAKQPRPQFRCLVAFASEEGFEILEKQVLAFLKRGGSVYVIVGIDLGGTSRQAVERLLAWKREFPGQVDARVFTTADNVSIFHPKVYWFDSDDRSVVVVGSANATNGGLVSNFEVSVEIALGAAGDDAAYEELAFLWMTYSSPLPPLSERNLIEIDAALAARLRAGRPPTDPRPGELHPLGGISPKPVRTRGRRVAPATRGPFVELVMDILEETRQTQVQLPVGSLSSFFLVTPSRKQSIQLSHVFRGSVVKSDIRPFIHLANNTHRLEVDAIRGLPRPQIIRFWRQRDDARNVYYEIVFRRTRYFKEMDALLGSEGEQTRAGARRWLVRDGSRKSTGAA